MKVLKISFTPFLLLLLVILANACKKGPSSCYDEQLYQQYKDKGCTADCPGVTGCDGKTYCNECEANRQGIRKK
ncbi:MAG TPA: kazal domain protein [Bacteroidia bacterium]